MTATQAKQYYFDIGATPLSPLAQAAMAPYLAENFGNPESIHAAGQAARAVLEQNRTQLAGLIHARQPSEIIFTGSATESDNLALKGVALAHYRATSGQLTHPHLLISPIEHPAVRAAALSLQDFGFTCEFLPVDHCGLVSPATLAAKIRPTTLLVSIIAANNQFGTIQDLPALGQVCQERSVPFHTDASVYFGLYDLDVNAARISLATLSSPKLYGPKGVAALYCRQGLDLYPQLHGGGQEAGRRSGTHNLPAIVGFVAAATAARQQAVTKLPQYQALSDYFLQQVAARLPHVRVNGDARHRLANNVHLSVLGVEGESLVLALNTYGIAASSGSACSSRQLQADPGLKALGLPPEAVHGSIRFFWHDWTTQADLDYLIDKLALVIKKLRQISAYKPSKTAPNAKND